MTMRTEIIGCIASGKTTLAERLEGAGFNCLYENFRANPFFKQFYDNPQQFSFETELAFLLQHYSQVRNANTSAEHLALDTSLLMDLAYANLNLEGEERAVFQTVYDHVLSVNKYPDFLIHIQCSAEESLKRVKGRNRPEEESMHLDYLAALNASIDQVVDEFPFPERVITINSEKLDFANSTNDVSEALALVHRYISTKPL